MRAAILQRDERAILASHQHQRLVDDPTGV
jgi:hypothetical protein